MAVGKKVKEGLLAGRHDPSVFIAAEAMIDGPDWKKRKAQAKRRKGNRSDLNMKDSPIPIRLDEEMGKALNMSRTTASQAIQIHDRASEDLKARVRRGELTINAAWRELVDMPRQNLQVIEKSSPKYQREVIESVRRIGIGATMQLYKLSNHRTFLKWLRSVTPEGVYPSCVKDIRGGEKARWLKLNRDWIIQTVATFGKDFLIENLPIEPDTLDSLLKFDKDHYTVRGDHNMGSTLSREIVEKQECQDLEIKGLKQQLFENRQKIDELKALYGEFVNNVTNKISAALINPIVQRLTAPDVPLNLAPDDSLKLADMLPVRSK